MKKEVFAWILGDVRDEYVEESEKAGRSRVLWLPWAAAAACLCLALVFALTLLPGGDTEPRSALSAYFDGIGVQAESIKNPKLYSNVEEPMVLEENLLDALRAAENTVQGTVTSLESVRIDDGNTIWFITVAELQIDEVLKGETGAETLRIIDAASITGGTVPADGSVCAPRLGGLSVGDTAVFILQGLNGPWTIRGEKMDPGELADYSASWVFDRDGNVLTYRRQGVSVSLEKAMN